MASQERLQKSLEVLKILSQNQPPDQSRKKDKIHHCYVVSEAFSNPTIKVSTNLPVLLEVTIETFLKLCDDSDADIRMTSEECLNRIIRVMSDGHTGKIQIELHKEIKKNGSQRSLRAALTRFSHLAHHIRPHKGKPYVVNLFPALIKIADRTEEGVHETLAACLPKILKVLGTFASDNEIRILLKAFLSNVVKPSPTMRRTSASCIQTICVNSRRPYYFLTYCLNCILDLVIPVDSNENSSLILGVFHCLKVLLPSVKNIVNTNEGLGHSKDVDVYPIPVNKLLQIFELCHYYLTSSDHNVINASLDTLNTLLLNATEELTKTLQSPNGIDRCRILKSFSINNMRSLSELSVSTNITSAEETSIAECELTETIDSNIVNWIGESKLSVVSDNNSKVNLDKKDSRGDSIDIKNRTEEYYETHLKLPEFYNMVGGSLSVNNNLDNLSDRLSEGSTAGSEEKLLDAEEGFMDIDVGDYLDKSVPLLYCTRLLSKLFLLSGIPNKYISDKTVRVSVKSSALTCLSSIFKLYPYGFFTYLDKNYSPNNSRVSSQRITDLMVLADHPDPQLRGIARCVASDVVVAILKKTHLNFHLWATVLEEHGKKIMKQNMFVPYDIDFFVRIWLTGLEDENSNCLRKTILALKPVLGILCESSMCTKIEPILKITLTRCVNPYWLVKVALCELVCELPYITINHLWGSVFQQQITYNVLLEFLKDTDQRIRSASSSAILAIIPHLHCETFHSKESHQTTKGILLSKKYISGIYDDKNEKDLCWTHFVENMPFPYSQISVPVCKKIDYMLSKIITNLYYSLLESNSKFFIFGCIEALSELSTKYPCTVYKLAWGIAEHKTDTIQIGSSKDLLGLCISLLNSSVHVYDILFLANLSNLTLNLYSGYAMVSVKPIDVTDRSSVPWLMFPSNEALKSLSEKYLLHAMRLLNIFHHVINDLMPTPPQSKTVLPHLPTTGTLSPIKRRKSDEKKLPLSGGKVLPDKDEKLEKKEVKITNFGCFASSQHYMKIFETLRSAFVNYKISLEASSSETFLESLRKAIHTLCVILEVGTINEFSRIAEEILSYLKTTFPLDRTVTLQCVQQLLKCLFGTNLIVNLGHIFEEPEKHQEDQNSSFYHNLFQKPYEDMSACIKALNSINKIECDRDRTIMGYLHRRDVKKNPVISRTSDKTLASYIRIFESMVINSLEQYTVTSDVLFQSHVLKLLCQLVQLRVNYCLLDSKQVFKDFVLKQFEYIEEGFVPHSDKLIPKIFQFLVQLSYSKQHSKMIIDVPKIIQLCDGLMASGQDPQTHCIPALKPIVEDIFLLRNRTNATDVKELETTREVILSMLLRLLEYKEVIDLVTLVLEDSKYCTDDTDKWLRWSGQVANIFLHMLKLNKIRIDDRNSFVSLRKFIFALNPNVFKPLDDVVIMIFREAPTSSEDCTIFCRWLSKLILLFLIISPLKEEELLSKINVLKCEFSPGSIFEHVIATADPLNVYNNADTFENLSSETIIARLILRVVSIISTKIMESSDTNEEFLVNQFSSFLLFWSYMFQSGGLCKVSQATSLLLHHPDINLHKINNNFMRIRTIYPTVVNEWSHILSILNYNKIGWWDNVACGEKTSINKTIVMTGSVIVLCDYLSENLTESEQLSWILLNHSETLINLIEEAPVSEFISFVHRNADLSKMFISSVSQQCLHITDAVFKMKILDSIENCHISQTGAVIKLLIPRMLCSRQMAVSRSAAHLASRKIEFLSTMTSEEVLKQLSKEDLFIIKEELNIKNFSKKYETLISLLNKLLVRYYDMSPLDFSQTRLIKPEYIRKLDINRKWLLSQIQGKYQDGMLRQETSTIMTKLEYIELASFMSSTDFNKIIFRDCIEKGVKLMKDKDLKQEPPILKATIDNILKDISKIVCEQCGSYEGSTASIKIKTRDLSKQLYDNDTFSYLLEHLCYSLSALSKHLYELPTLELAEIDCENIAKFSIIALDHINFIIKADNSYLDISTLEILLDCANEILKQSQFSSYIGLDANVSWLCAGVSALYHLIEFLLRNDEPLPSIDRQVFKLSTKSPNSEAQNACHNLYTLTCWLYKNQNKYVKIPIFLLCRIKSLIVSLARLPLVNSFIFVPHKVWKLGWHPDLSGKFSTQVPQLPIDMLQEIDVLEEYIFRATLLGWTTRQQFEEMWMCFLSVLCSPLDSNDLDTADLARRASTLAIKAITAQLLQSFRYPVLGNKNVSKIMHVSRNTPMSETSISMRKLKLIQNHIEYKYNEELGTCVLEDIKNVFNSKNFEKITDQYSYGQVSVKYLLACTSTDGENSDIMFKKRNQLLEESGLDINSCLQFLLDYYTQIMKSQSTVVDLRILHETVRSTLYISDLFNDKSQFSWMLDIFLDLAKVHAVEDELLHQFLIVGICKAVGVLTPDLEVYEQTKKLLVQFLKSPFLPTRISSLHGLLYVLEGCILSNIAIGGISEELQLILPCAVEYIQVNLSSNHPVLKKSQEHALVLWSLAFYILENVDEHHVESNFVANTLQLALHKVQKTSMSCIDKCILKGLERLLLIRPMYTLEKIGKSLQKLALEKMRDENPSISILGFQLLVTYMYVDCWEHLEKPEVDSEQTSPDHLVQTIEKISAIFDRIKKSYINEAEVLCSVLPLILKDFFSPSDILTKVIGEFLSSQQPHPKLMSGVVFQVFDSAIQLNQLSLLQDWVVFSLSNFTQSFSNMAVWSLTCFFISASPNLWLKAYFPYVQSRVGRYEYEDKKIFCIAGADFYNNLTSDNQRKAFVDSFMKVKDHTDMPFSDLLNSL
ncbi:huntingtin-like [Anthonomus grandis grandis]|uniref:huntingtin-like n=1 Tax=Anthonomus grandis grandis TaxID=2921223 RepID=UPI002166B1EC|nr:huntingtin-like [Anthonomus grandis grandis]